MFGALAEPDPQKQEEQIRTYTFTIFLVGVGGALCQLISSSALGKSGEELTVRMRGMSFRSMLKQEIGWFDLDENNLGALVTRLSSDAASLKGLTGQTLGAILNALGALLFALVVTFTAGWKLTLVLFSFTPLMIFTGTVRGKQDAKKFGAKDSPTTDVEEGGKVNSLFHRFALADLSDASIVSACDPSDREHPHRRLAPPRRTFHSAVPRRLRPALQVRRGRRGSTRDDQILSLSLSLQK